MSTLYDQYFNQYILIWRLSEHTEKIAQRIALLESDKENLSRQLTAEKEKNKK